MTRVGNAVLPMHPEIIAGDPQAVRWVLPPSSVPFVGPVRRAPGALGELVAAGVIREISCESCAVLVRLTDGRGWRDVLPEVRDALSAAIAEPGWQPYDEAQCGCDALLTAAVHEVLAGPAGDYVRSHGGAVNVESVVDGRVEVSFDGTCGHCPATGITLHDRLEVEVRRKYPALESIMATNAGRPKGLQIFKIGRRRDC